MLHIAEPETEPAAVHAEAKIRGKPPDPRLSHVTS